MRAKKKKKYNQSSAIRAALRTAWKYHPHKKIALDSARKEMLVKNRRRVFRQCAGCMNLFEDGDVQVDHIDPVGPAPGSKNAGPEVTWDSFIDRLFCGVLNLAVLCKLCHAVKTQSENQKRRLKAAK